LESTEKMIHDYKSKIWQNKTLLIIAIMFLIMVVAGLLYACFGHEFIRAVYEGRSIGFFNKIIEEQTIHPVEFFFEKADELFFISNFILGIIIFLYFVFQQGSKPIFYGIIACYVVYCIIFIAKVSFLNNGVRIFTLFDDAMISMRYAKNLAKGYGLVWNPGGARVEGYTNFLWTIYMAFWHLFPISITKIALPIQISGMLFLISSLFLVRKIADHISDGNKYVSMGAVLLTASYLPINFWALRGMETSVLGFIVLLVTWRFLKLLKEKKFDTFLFVILGIAMLTRADFAFLFVGITLFLIIAEPENKKKNFLFAIFVFLLVAVGHTLFRWLYYGDILPNTYYAKMTGVSAILRARKGLWEAVEFIYTMSPILFVLPFIYSVLHRKNVKVLFLLYVFLLQLFYSIYVGGDVWEWWGHFANRYLCIVMPMFFILIFLMVNYLMEMVKGFRTDKTGSAAVLKNFCYVIILVFIVFQMHGGLRNLDIIRNELFGFSGVHVEDDKYMVKVGLKLKEVTTPDAKIAVLWAGAIPYFSDRFSIDFLGKTDAFVSHLPARVTTYKDFHPGHNKYNYDYSIGKLRPDVIAQLFNQKEAFPWLIKYYKALDINKARDKSGRTMYFRKDSQNIFWDKAISLSD